MKAVEIGEVGIDRSAGEFPLDKLFCRMKLLRKERGFRIGIGKPSRTAICAAIAVKHEHDALGAVKAEGFFDLSRHKIPLWRCFARERLRAAGDLDKVDVSEAFLLAERFQ